MLFPVKSDKCLEQIVSSCQNYVYRKSVEFIIVQALHDSQITCYSSWAAKKKHINLIILQILIFYIPSSHSVVHLFNKICVISLLAPYLHIWNFFCMLYCSWPIMLIVSVCLYGSHQNNVQLIQNSPV